MQMLSIRVVLPSGVSAGPDSVAGLPAFEAMRRHQRLTVGVPFLSPLTRRHVVSVVHPRFDALGKFLGGVALALDLVRLQSVLDGMQTSASEAQLAVTQDGRVVASSLDAERWVGQDLAQHLAQHPLVAWARSGEQGAFEAPGLDGAARYWSVRTMRSTGWFVLYGKDRDAVLEPYYRAAGLHRGRHRSDRARACRGAGRRACRAHGGHVAARARGAGGRTARDRA